ncbi:MAG: DUF3601 domain-containing protein [bacterium]
MFGPKPKGTWSNLKGKNCGKQYQFLISGIRYRVIEEFYDYDHHLHPVDEVWTFLGYSFLPYEDGLSWFVSMDGVQEWHIRMKCTGEEQSEIVNSLKKYLREDLFA